MNFRYCPHEKCQWWDMLYLCSEESRVDWGQVSVLWASLESKGSWDDLDIGRNGTDCAGEEG